MRWIVVLLALAAAGCGSSGHPLPTPTPVAVANRPLQSFTSTDGVHFRLGPTREAKGLWGLSWRTVRFTRGRLILSHFRGFASTRRTCERVAVVQVGPSRGRFRHVLVLSKPHSGPCRNPPHQIELEPPGWTQKTVAVSQNLDVPDARFKDQPEGTAIPGLAVLQPDRQTIVVQYEYGGCEALAGVTAHRSGSIVTVDARVGVDLSTMEKDSVCPMFLTSGTTYVRLPEPAPADAKVEVVRCGSWRMPPC